MHPRFASPSSLVKKHFTLFARSIEFSEIIENFILSAVTTIIVVRIFLRLAGYPQLGGGGLHIAHMLWGGLFLALALLISVSFLNKEAKRLSVVLGGIGFGLFIDEIGKFVTSDNNYFYQPTFALIYLVFVLLFFSFRFIMSHQALSPHEYAMNAVEEMKEVLYLDLDEDEKQRTLQYLQKSDASNPLVKTLIQTLETVAPHTQQKDISIFFVIKKKIRALYWNYGKRAAIARFIAICFILLSLYRLVAAIQSLEWTWNFWIWGSQLGSIFVSIWILQGFLAYQRKQKVLALRHFQRAVVISILVVQIFDFYHDELLALIGLVFGGISYITLEYLISEERIDRLSNRSLTPHS
ncbi:hypothetical protein KBD71_03740 [Candidatus Woesebacteria bacterium]|nr:hypothetical protein [Candidatus Woesebacteria bacterium]